MPLTAHTQVLVLDALARDEVPSYFALFSDLEATSEIAVAGYQRVEYLGGWLDGGGARVNAVAVEWPQLQEDVVVRSVGLFDAAVGGHLLAWSRTLTLQGAETEVVVVAGDSCALPAGGVRFGVGKVGG